MKRWWVIAAVVALAVLVIGATLYFVWQSGTKVSSETETPVAKSSVTTDPQDKAPAKAVEPDSVSTLESPQKVTTADGRQYFYYGAPAGQNNASPKKIIISLPGHETTAESDYAAWKSHLTGGSYALASLNWWEGGVDTKAKYYSPAEVVAQTRQFLTAQGYVASDLIILEGYSRGSANSYAVIANDRGSGAVFDAAISASGRYQSDFRWYEDKPNGTISPTFFKNVVWVLACGGKDPSPEQGGCLGMEETKTFLVAHGANVLAVLEDPNGNHGAFHLSSLDLPEQALALIVKALGI